MCIVEPITSSISVHFILLLLLLDIDVVWPLLFLLHLHGAVVARFGEAEVIIDDSGRPGGSITLLLLIVGVLYGGRP